MIRHKDALQLRLSRTEKIHLTLFAQGFTDDEVSDRIGCCIRTVQFHLANVRDKLGAKNTREAVAIAVKRGEIECPFCKK